MITIFTWGYWGWGSATRQLVQSVDALERKRGFKRPIFVDIRFSRAVRAIGFSGPAFENLLGDARYRHFGELGNQSVRTHEEHMHVVKPKKAKDLLALAVEAHKKKQRVIFFCSCKDVDLLTCHRHKVANLVLREACKANRRVEIVEWPGGVVERRNVKLDHLAFGRITTDSTVPLRRTANLAELAWMPWGTIVSVTSSRKPISFVSGPAKYHDGWRLPVLAIGDDGEGYGGLKSWSERFRKKHGFEPNRT